MQINGSQIYVNESGGVIGPMFLRVRGFMGFVVSWFHRLRGFISFVVSYGLVVSLVSWFHSFCGCRGFNLTIVGFIQSLSIDCSS